MGSAAANETLTSKSDVAGSRNMGRSVRYLFTASVIYTACQCFALLSVVKLGTPQEVGQFSMAFACCAPLFMFANLELRTVLATDVQNRHSFKSYLVIRCQCIAAALLLAAVLSTFLPTQYTQLIVVMAAAKAFESLSDILYGHWQRQQEFRYIARSQIRHGIVTLASFTTAFALTHQLWISLAAMALGRAICTAIDYTTGQLLSFSMCEKIDTASLWRVGIPLGMTAVIISLNSNVPRYFIASFSSAYMVGVFCAIATVMTFGNMVHRSIEQYASPTLAAYVAQGDNQGFWRFIYRIITMYLAGGTVAMLTSLGTGHFLISIILNPAYAIFSHLLTLFILAIMVGLVAGVIYSAMIACRLIRWQVPLQLVSLTVSVVVCYLLVPSYGVWGAALALCISKLPFIAFGLALLSANQSVMRANRLSVSKPIKVSYSA